MQDPGVECGQDESRGCGFRWSELKPWLCHLQAWWTQASYLTFLHFGSHTHKSGVTRVPAHKFMRGLHAFKYVKHSAEQLPSKCSMVVPIMRIQRWLYGDKEWKPSVSNLSSPSLCVSSLWVHMREHLLKQHSCPMPPQERRGVKERFCPHPSKNTTSWHFFLCSSKQPGAPRNRAFGKCVILCNWVF